MDRKEAEHVVSDLVETNRSICAEETGRHLTVFEETASIGQVELPIRNTSINKVEVGESRFGECGMITW